MTIDEAIERMKNKSKLVYSNQTKEDWLLFAEWLEELKSIKEIDLDIPQNFTKEQSEWIKAYCINRNKEFYDKAVDDYKREMIEFIQGDEEFADWQKREMLELNEIVAEQLKENKNE